jgi:glycosyltransferase involved in cell wall biosynthesis
MKILWFSHRDIDHDKAGGVERTTYEISRRLVAKGDEVTWATCRFPGASTTASLDGVRIVRAGSTASVHLKVGSLIRSLGPDVVVDDLGHVVPWFSELTSGPPGTAFFHHLHSRTLPGQVGPGWAVALTWLEKQYPRIYKRWPFVTEGRQAASDLQKLGVPATRIVRIPPGVDLYRFRPGRKSPKPTIVYFGGFREYKRPWVPIIVYGKLRKRIPDLTLLMIGTSSDEPRLKATLGAMGNARIAFPGRLTDPELGEVVSRAWVNIHSSVSEGWGFSILEAAAAGTPTVAFAAPGVSDTIEPGVNGLIVPDGDIEALADAAERILVTKEEWVTRTRKSAVPFNWDLSADRWKDHLNGVSRGKWTIDS